MSILGLVRSSGHWVDCIKIWASWMLLGHNLWVRLWGHRVSSSAISLPCSKILHDRFIGNLKWRKELWINFKCAAVTFQCISCTEVLRMRQDNIQISSCLMLQLSFPPTNRSSRIVREIIYCLKLGQKTAPSCSRPWGSCRRKFCVVFESGIRSQSWLSPFWKRSPASFFNRNDWWSLVWMCNFHWDRCFLTDDLFSFGHSFLVLCSGMHKVCHGCAFFGPHARCSRRVSPCCENLFHKGESALLLRQRIAPNWVYQRRIDWNLYWWVPINNMSNYFPTRTKNTYSF